MSNVQVRRIYDEPQPSDGHRVLVDRLWPRGVSKERAALDEWCKDIAPSDELRKWYGHDPAKYDEFVARYRLELETPERQAAYEHLRNLARNGTLTLLTSTKEVALCKAQLLANMLNAEDAG